MKLEFPSILCATRACILSLAALLPMVTSAQQMGTPGAFRVTEAGGAAFTMPIEIPPGIGGVAPKLTLDYDSTRGAGLAGQGFELGGLSAITRCPQKPYLDNNTFGVVSYNYDDRFCLDGQRLSVIVNSYGAANSEYRTLPDSFSRVTAYGSAGNGPAYFIVKTKSGLIMEYGNTGDSRIEAMGQSTVRTWALNKVSDTKGNYMTWTYVRDTANGEFYPSYVSYTGNAAMGQTTPPNQVQFTWEARPDVQVAYQAGASVTRVSRLAEVKTLTGVGVVSRYRLSYAAPENVLNRRSQLTKVQRCNFDLSNCLAPATFEWPAKNESMMMSKPITQKGPINANQSWSLSDIDGDGKPDFVVMEGGVVDVYFGGNLDATPVRYATGTSNTSSIALADLNGDGLPDIAIFTINPTTYSVNVMLNAGNRTFQAPQQWLAPVTYQTDIFGPIKPTFVGFADYDGDGKADFHVRVRGEQVGTFPSSTDQYSENLYVYRNTGSSFVQVQKLRLPGGLIPSSFKFADFTGDGRSEFNNFGSSPPASFSGGDNGYISTGAFGSGFNGVSSILDVNGDGRADFWYLQRDNDLVSIYVELNNGSGLNAPVKWADRVQFWDDRAQYFPADVNGDGLPDIVYITGGSLATYVDVYLNTGTSFVKTRWVEAAIEYNPNDRWMPADLYGDGKTGLVRIFGENGYASVQYLRSNAGNMAISKFNNGLGGSITPILGSMTDPTIYTKGSGATYPVNDLVLPLQLVKSVQSNDGVGGVITTNYQYGKYRTMVGAVNHGALGFEWVQSTQSDTQLTIRNSYRQDRPYVGMLSQVLKTTPTAAAPGQKISQTDYAYACSLISNGASPCGLTVSPYSIYSNQTTEQSWDLNGTALPSSTMTKVQDDYGNVTSMTQSTSDGYSKTTDNQYTNDFTNWFLGRLVRAQVTSVKQ